DDHGLTRNEMPALRSADHHPTAGESLGDVVVRLALELERDTAGEERTKALSGGPAAFDGDRAVGQPCLTKATRDLAGQHRADRPIDVSHVERGHHRLAARE